MFDDTLSSSWDERSRRRLTTLTSFGLQALVVAVLLALPVTLTAWAVIVNAPPICARVQPPIVATGCM